MPSTNIADPCHNQFGSVAVSFVQACVVPEYLQVMKYCALVC